VQQTLLVTKRYESWGRYPKARHAEAVPVLGSGELPQLDRFPGTVLPYGQGRSYGDCCQNDGGILLDTSAMRRFLAFDEQQGILRCEVGITFLDILERIVPRGWFLPVVPGTKWISLGGAIANDVHGKNHHRAGTFGCHVRQFQLLRSNGEQLLCSSAQNAGLFEATIAGLGLTGLVLWAEIQLKRIASPMIQVEQIRFATLEEFFELSVSSDEHFEYTVAWLDCTATGRRLGRGIFLRGNHADGKGTPAVNGGQARKLRIPFDAPNFLLNHWTIRAFNSAYFHAGSRDGSEKLVPYDTFFFPLDAIEDWNRLYGPRGFLQYQCVVRPRDAVESIGGILRAVERAGAAPALSVLKMFGSNRSPGMMSFPRPGTTLALDFAFEGEKTLRLLNELDEIVLGQDGAVYAAKDARMSAGAFQKMYPQWREFCEFVDPKFSSSLWRRVTGGGTKGRLEAYVDRRGNLSDRP
jgi:FAD/FMN-containing dehydrogenase